MKKILLYLLGAVAALALASCAREPELGDPERGGQPVPVTFSLNLGNAMTKAAPESSVFDDASGEFQLYAAAFSKSSGTLMTTSMVGGTGYQPVGKIDAGSASVTLTLSRNQEYRVVFFAMHPDAYDVQFGDGNLAKFSFKRSLKANDASLDAFYASVDVTSSSTNYSVELKRPFAQINVLATKADVPKGQTAFSSSMSVLAPVNFDLFAGAAGTEVEEIAFASNAISAAALGKYKDSHVWIGMNYVLVPAAGTVTVNAFTESGMTEGIKIGVVPVKVNGRTNLVGNIYSLTDFHFNLQINSDFGSEEDIEGGSGGGSGQGEETVITLGNGETYTPESPLTVTAAQSVSVLVNGDSFATVEAGANGAKVTATSSNNAVATAEIKDGAVLITPKANGTATVTISTPAYTKTDYAAQTFEIPVKVEGMDVPPAPTSDTIVFADLNLENGTQYKDPFTQGKMSVQFGSGTNDGKYYTTGTGMRIYGDGWVTVSSEQTIVKIEYTFDTTEQKDGDAVKTFIPDDATFGSVDSGSYDLATQTWTGSAKSVKLTRATGTGHWRLQQIVVSYGSGGDTPPQPVTATLTVTPASLNLTAGQQATLTASTNSTATPSFSTGNGAVAKVDQNGNVTAVAAGSTTITVAVAAVEGAFTAASKTVQVTVTAAGGGGGTGSDPVVLTLAEIKPATVDAEITGENPSYRDGTISSASGTWTGNFAKHANGVNFLQLRNKKGAYITSPAFTSAISKVEVTMSSDASVTLADRTLHAVPPATTLPTGQSNGKDIVYSATEWASEYGCVRTGTEKGATVTIDFAEGSDVKQFKLIVEGGATYIDQIKVYY